MNCAYKIYLYIYNMELIEKSILSIKKKIKHVFFCSNFFHLLIQPNIFLEQKLFSKI